MGLQKLHATQSLRECNWTVPLTFPDHRTPKQLPAVRYCYCYCYTLFLPRGKVRLQTSCSKGCQNPTPCWTRQIQARFNQLWAWCSVFVPLPASRGQIRRRSNGACFGERMHAVRCGVRAAWTCAWPPQGPRGRPTSPYCLPPWWPSWASCWTPPLRCAAASHAHPCTGLSPVPQSPIFAH